MANEIGYLIQIDKETKEGYKYPVTQNYLIGNSVECNFKITEKNILDVHCRISRVDNEVCISSLNSENPVFVNGEAVSEKGKALKHCDTIRITDNHEFEWNTTDRKIFSRSLLPVENEPLVQENTRYSDSALTCWKRVDRPFEEQVDIAPQNQEEDELEVISEAPGTEYVDTSIPRESDRYPGESGNKIKRLTNTPIKSRKSKNPVSPFALSNTFISESKSNASKILHQNDNDDMEFERTTKNIPEDVFEDLIQHASSQTAFHSTPKVASKLKNKKNVRASSSSLLDNNFESNSSKVKSFNDTLEKNEKFEENSISKISNQNEEKKANSSSKKITFTPAKRASEGFCESRRNTRGRTSLLRKTFEENSCDNENKSLTTPEKLTESNNVAENSFPVDSEIDTAADTNTEFKYLDESLKSGFTSVSDENVTCEGSFIDKYKICNVLRSAHDSKNSSVAKCVRNLSCISPPENNRSQEYMDSMSSTPQKNSPSVRESIVENYDVSLMSCDETSMDRSLSSVRKRRSTGFTPFVGTPSNEYRVTRRMSTTPFSKSLLSRTSVDFESNGGQSRDSKYSFERRSTPFKAPAGKSSIRDSISCQPIPESVSFEELEASNHEQDSTNDSKFRFITTRRGRRYGDNIFAAKEKILEESELKSDDDGSFEEENTEISVTNASAFSEIQELTPEDKTKTKTVKDTLELKSILTPLPKSSTLKEKSAKRVTFVLPNSPECTVIEENSTFSVDESFAMISTSKPNQDRERSLNSDNVTVEEELHLSSRLETDPSNNSFSELADDSNATYSIDENSSNAISACSTKIQSSLNDLSGVEQIEPSPTKCSTILDTSEQGSSVKANTLSETSNLTSSIAESSNRSCLPEKESTEPRNEIKSLEEITENAVNENIKNISSTKISFSPAVHLSGVKSLSKTPEKFKLSSGDAEFSNSKTNVKTAAEIKSSLARKSAEVAKNIASFKSSRMCKSLNLNEIVTSKSETSPAEKAQTEESKITNEVSKNEVDAENEIVDEKEIVAEYKSSLARKSTEISRNIASFKSSRMCKSLNLNEIATSKSETSPAENVLVEESKTTDEVSENIVDAESEVTVDQEIATENESNAESTSNEEVIEFDATNEKNLANLEPPEIIITESTFVDENANDEPLELVNENQTEVSEPINVESSSTVQLEDMDDNFETSEFEESGVGRDGTLSSESSTNDEEGSPVLTQIRRSALPKSHSAAKISSIDDKIQPEENKSLTATSIVENECEKQAELNSSSNTPSANVPSESTILQPNNDNNEATENVSQLSSDVMVSDFDSSKLSDVLSTEYMADADSSKNSNNLSICNDSQLSDFSSKDTSDLDSVQVNVDNSDSKISDLSANNTNASVLSSNSISENKPIELSSEKQVSAEEIGDVNSMENNVNRKTEIIECLSPELEAPKNIDENQKDISMEEICDTNLANISQSTSSSQDMGIRIDASSALINDLHKKLESTPQLSSASQDEATPADNFNLITFPESTNISSIEFTSQSKSENFKKPESVFTTENIGDVLTPIKTDFRASSTPQSTLRRCRRSSRIHRCNPDKSSTSLHECSIISDNSVTHFETENAKESENLQQVVTENLDSESTIANEITKPTEELSNEGNISENQSVQFTSEKAKANAAPISPAPATTTTTTTTTTSPSLSPSISSVVIESSDFHTKEDQQVDHSPEVQTVDNVHVDQPEISDVGEVILETRKVSLIDEGIAPSINISIPRLATQTTDPEQPTSPTIGAVQEIKKRLRTRKMQPETSVEESSKQGVVTRNRKKAPAPLWLGKHFHCYLCLNSSGKFYKCVRKTTAKQVERKLKDHDDKENVYSLPKVADKSKKTELSGEPITTSVPSTTEKKPKKPPQRFKNLENNAADVPSEEVDKDVFSKRSCSIVLPLLDPVIIIKSPVKVDESGKIFIQEDPPVTSKRKRVAKADSSSKKQTEPSISRTRQKQIKTVTFEAEDEESEDVDQQTDEEIHPSKVIKPKRNLRNQSKTAETEVTTRSRKTAIETEKKLKIKRTIKIQLKPVNENAFISEPETVEKKIKPKRGAATLKNSEDANKGTNEGKSVLQKRAKRAPENTEESIPKRRRGKTETNDGIPSKEAAKLENDEIATELPKRTRRQIKTIDQEIPVHPVSNLARSTRATKTKPLENFAVDDGVRSKKRIMDVDQSSALNDAEKSNKRTKISKNTDFVNPDNKAVEKKTDKKTIITKENSSTSIRPEKPIASSSKTIPSPRITRNNRKTIIVQEKTKPVTKKTRVIKDEKPSLSVSLLPVNVEASDNVTKSAAVKKVETKRAVVTRNKNLSKKNGRISTTLKTTGKSTRVSRKPSILVVPSSAEVASETSNRRITRSRAK